MLHKLVNITKL